MQDLLLSLLRCPVTGSPLQLTIIRESVITRNNIQYKEVEEGILTAGDWMYPVIGFIPGMNVESFLDHGDFLSRHLPGFEEKRKRLLQVHRELIDNVIKKNKRTKESFSKEWKVYDYDKDKTFLADDAGMLERFYAETGQQPGSLAGKLILDAGCGNGKLDTLIAGTGATVIAMDFSSSVEQAHRRNTHPNAQYVQADVQFPPFAAGTFDIVHCSGVLIHTNNTEYSFSRIAPLVKDEGLLSTWLYHPRRDKIHNLFNRIRNFTSRLPLGFQYYLYCVTLFPVSFVVKRLKGNRQNPREMMVDILDWFSPEFRWEHTHEEASGWFQKYGFYDIRITTTNNFGFNITGRKKDKQ